VQFPHNRCNDLVYGHSRGYTIGVDDNVGRHARGGKGHVFLGVYHTTGTFLGHTRAKFVSNLGHAQLGYDNFDDSATVHSYVDHSIYAPFFTLLNNHTVVGRFLWGVFIFRGCFTNQDVTFDNSLPLSDHTCLVQQTVIVVARLYRIGGCFDFFFDQAVLPLSSRVSSKSAGSKQPSLYGRFVKNYTVFLVVASVTSYGYYGVDAVGIVVQGAKIRNVRGH
jgi:hypothetical protein